MSARFAFTVIALSLAMGVSAHAEPLVADSDNLQNGETLTLTLPAGRVEISMDQTTGTQLIVHAENGEEARFNGDLMPRLLKIYRNSALLELNNATRCSPLFGWVTLDSKGLRVSEDFGTCAQDADYEVSKKGPVVSMKDLNNPTRVAHYLYDPTTNKITETEK